jgi:uncharacterized membrane protein YeaQ/YmgE (transglycosylase-associated protein family)
MSGFRCINPFADIKELVMGIIAWVILGLVSGLLAQRLLPGRSAHRLILTCVTGVCGALSGGWAAVSLFHTQALNAFFSIPAWLTALTGAAIFLLASRTLSGRSGEPWPKGKGAPIPVPVPVPARGREPMICGRAGHSGGAASALTFSLLITRLPRRN